MASLANQTISSTYDGLIKTSTDQPVGVSGVQLLEDGVGNTLALSVGRANQGATVTGTLTATTLAGTLSTAAQPNITSVGTLTSLTTVGDVNITNATGISILNINGSTTGASVINLGDSDDNNVGRIYYDHTANFFQIKTSDTEVLRIDSAGNVGIGTSNPATTLEIAKDDIVDGVTLRLKNTHNGADWGAGSKLGVIDFYSQDSSGVLPGVLGAIELIQESASTTYASQADFVFKPSDAGLPVEVMRIAGDGAVGINTSTPYTALDVSSGIVNQVAIFRSSDATATIGFADNTTPLTANLSYVTVGAVGNNMVFNTNLAERMRIESSGRVSINGLSNGADLTILEQGASSALLQSTGGLFLQSGSATSLVFQTDGANERMRIDSSGNVGIGESSPEQFAFSSKELHIKGGTGVNQSAIVNIASSQSANGFLGALTFVNGSATNEFQRRVAQISINADSGGADTSIMNFFTKGGAGNYAERMRIDSNGNVGIGMIPSQLLDLQATDNLSLRFYNSTSFKAGIQVATSAGDMVGSSAIDDLGIRSQSNILFATGGNTERMRIDSSGYVGIGTSPSAKLHINAGTDNYAAVFESTDANALISFKDNNSASILANYIGAITNDLVFGANSLERMRIDSSGNVIVGSTTANNGNAATLRQDGTAHVNNVQLANAAGSAGGTTPSIYSPAGGQLAISLNSAERLRIDGSGNVGIGTTPSYPLHIASATNNILRLQSTDATVGNIYMSFSDSANSEKAYIGFGGSSNDDFSIWNRENADVVVATNNTERMRITSGGQVLIGTTSANASELLNLTNDAPILFAEATNGVSGFRINVLGGSSTLFRLQSNGTSVFTVYNNGNYDFAGSDVSDIALKENITEITSGMPIINALVPKTYNMIGREGIRKGGFIAQEVEQILPEAVHGEDGQKGLDYNSILAHAVKAIQELKAEVESLKSQINA